MLECYQIAWLLTHHKIYLTVNVLNVECIEVRNFHLSRDCHNKLYLITSSSLQLFHNVVLKSCSYIDDYYFPAQD